MRMRGEARGLLLVWLLTAAPVAAQPSGADWVDLQMTVDCPERVFLEDGIEVSMSASLPVEIPVQIVQAVLPDPVASISVREHEADGIVVRHPLLENRPGSGVGPKVVASYGRYEMALRVPLVQAFNRPASGRRPLSLRFWVRPIRTGTFHIQFHTAVRSEEGFYSYYPTRGPVSAYDEIALVCQVEVASRTP